MTRSEAISCAPKFVTQKEAAEILGVTDRTVRAMIADGRLVGYRGGRRIVRLRLDEVENALKPMCV
ncbi:excisionase family DNA-binding protein [Mycobacteroides abscessus]|uniref:excisionase family DNA-binding protein n=1 Tax=Mycobacteroides abscessus TaxID=36809 RepID=UPI000516050E|nr:excisionase family DNA-binding protein [Mycobacteroides abscessus]